MPEVLECQPQGLGVPEMPSTLPSTLPSTSPSALPSTLFDRCWRQYALCREHLFTDHTQQIAAALQPILDGPTPRYIVEAGCGPGFYSRRLAAKFPQLHITGIDLSEPLLLRARNQARRLGLANCRFMKADALSLADFPDQVDAVIASRLLLILAEPAQALDAIFTALRPGGLCFIAEPTSLFRASIPLMMMKLTERLGRSAASADPVPHSRVLSVKSFAKLLESQPWQNVQIWNDRRYQCAICKKAA